MSEAKPTTGWGDATTKYFFELTPDRVLEAVESAGLLCTGRCQALNSFENRVYDVELETEDGTRPANLSANRRVAKFYRPGRWTEKQILEEHEFLLDLKNAEIPVIAPLAFPDGTTLKKTSSGILYTLFPKVGGRAPEELTDDQLRWIGRLLARIHQVGAAKKAESRVRLTPDTYGISNLEFLLQKGLIPAEFRTRYEKVVRQICDHIRPWFAETSAHRVHGDCHLGNLLWGNDGPFFLDFDDMCVAPAVQDLWLLLPNRDRALLDVLLEGYEEIREFDRSSLKLIEPLRALRFIHYTGWVARRWEDPAFPLAFPNFGTHRYWNDETEDLERQWSLISLATMSATTALPEYPDEY